MLLPCAARCHHNGRSRQRVPGIPDCLVSHDDSRVFFFDGLALPKPITSTTASRLFHSALSPQLKRIETPILKMTLGFSSTPDFAAARRLPAFCSFYAARGKNPFSVGPSSVQILQSNTEAFLQGQARRGDLPQKLWMVLDPVIEPIVLRFEADQDTGRSAVPSDDDFFNSCHVQVLR